MRMTRNIFDGCSRRAAPVPSLLFETGGWTNTGADEHGADSSLAMRVVPARNGWSWLVRGFAAFP